MQTHRSSVRQLSSGIVLRIFDIEELDDEYIQELPRHIITRITGKPVKQIYGTCLTKKRASFKRSLEKMHNTLLPETQLEKNLHLLASIFNLPEHTKPLIQLCVLTSLNQGLHSLLVDYTFNWSSDINSFMSELLDISIDEFLNALETLSTTPVFKQNEPCLYKLLTMPVILARNLLLHKTHTYSDLLNGMYHQATPTKLTLSNYPHLELQYVSEYLKQAVKTNTVGINILLHGAAGTGKTELSKVLTQYSKSLLIEVKAIGEDQFSEEDELNSRDNVARLRLKHYRLMQSLFESEIPCCLLLDEVEDVFMEYLDGVKISKERLHQVLATNTLPCFWITNHPEMLPDSVIRRMSYVIEVPPPPKHIKAEILSTPLTGLRVSKAYKKALANIPDLTPAHVVNASMIAKGLNLTGKKAETCMNHYLDECLSACGFQTSFNHYTPEMCFDPRFIHLSGSHTKIEQVIETMTQFISARCLLLGSAGTGKSAFAHYISEVLAQELITIKPSDVLSKYVGEAEQNIAQLFKQASESNAIIFIDEIDSVLTARSELNNQHERVLVNEILLQLERCEQTVFAATNLAQSLDNALLRRFDYKLNFEYLTQQQVIDLFEESFGKCSTTIQEKLAKLTCLTPGDFAVAVRRNRMSQKPLSDTQLHDILTQENNRKIQNKAIGFVS